MQTATPGGFQQQSSALPPGTSPTPSNLASYAAKPVNGGRFDFDDGGTYCGGWEDGKAHGHGVCTGPKGQGEYSGSWHFGFEVSGVYTWPSGSTFEGQWQNGKRHGLGMEYRGRWTYRGEWTQGFKGRYGVRQATASSAKYEGTWANGLQDGYGSEAYADGGTYQGQWLRGLRHGYGVRTSAPFGMASHFRPKAPTGSMASLKSDSAADPTSERDRRMDDVRGGFVLKARSDDPPGRRRSLVEKSSNIKESILKGLKLRKQRSTGDLDKKGATTNTSIRSTVSSSSWMSNDSAQSGVTSGSHHTDSNASFVVEDEHMDTNVTETYMGEWKNDKRSGFGISERTDGLKYEGEWYNNKKYGYGVTTLKDGTKEEGKYKNNVLITSQKKKHLFLMRSAKFRERIDAAVNAAQRASKIALQKADIAISRTSTARGKAEQADIASSHAREDSEIARVIAKQFAPDFHQPGTEIVKPQQRAINSNQTQHQVPDLRNKIMPKLRDEGPPHVNVSSSRHSREREMSMEPSYNDPATSYAQHNSQAHPSQVHNTPSSAYNTSIPDRLDGASHASSRLDSASIQHDQQHYPNRSSDSTQQSYNQARLSHQNLTDLHGGSGGAKGLMGNNVGGGGGSSRLRDPIGNQVSRNAPQPASMNYPQNVPGTHSQHFQQYAGSMEQASSASAYDHPRERERGRDTMRRSSQMMRPNNPNPSSYNYQQAMSDHFDHYKRPPSRDRETSRDRYSRPRSVTRAQTPEVQGGFHSRAPSRGRTPFADPPPSISPALSQNPIRSSNVNLEMTAGHDSVPRRAETPSRNIVLDSGKYSDTSSNHGSGGFDEAIIRKRGLGQEIHPALYTPKRTESLFLKCGENPPPPLIPTPPSKIGGGSGVPLKRKKSLPDAASLPKATPGMSREEISALGSARRQELHRLQDEAERKRANPLLYLLNPNFKNWFSRQKLMVLVLLVNLSLAIMFLQLLT